MIVHSRHGARTPAWDLPLDFEENFEPSYKGIYIKGKQGSEPGQLTTLGARQMKDIGEQLQWFYVYKLGFLKGQNVSLFSTHVKRTSDSLNYLMKGLFPRFEGNIPIKVCKDLSVTSRRACPRFSELQKGYFKTENYKNWINDVYTPQEVVVKEVTRESKDINSGVLYDRFETHRRHSNSPSSSLIPDDIHSLLEQRALRDWFGPYYDYPGKQEETTMLAINRLLKKTSDDLKLAASSSRDEIPQMLIHVSHDTTLAPFLANYGLLNERWPHFASTFILELWERDDRSFLVRAIYNEKVVPIPKCKDQWVEEGRFCPLERFLELTKYTMDHVAACGGKID